jgi:hypothetical protein
VVQIVDTKGQVQDMVRLEVRGAGVVGKWRDSPNGATTSAAKR